MATWLRQDDMGGGLDGPLPRLPQDRVARQNPALGNSRIGTVGYWENERRH
jgi:hypothetical protein